MSYEWTIDLA